MGNTNRINFKSIAICGLAPLLYLASSIADTLNIAKQFSGVIKPIMYITAIITLIFFFYYISASKKNIENAKKVSKLERAICDGMQFTKNDVKVTFDLVNNRYMFEFKKYYTILTESVKWYPAQFYCNRILDDAEISREYYKENPVPWEILNIKAHLRYKNEGESDFTKNYDLEILKVAEGINYKLFHIQYKTTEDDKLNIYRGAHVELYYSYEVPENLWGSYINRSISYFAEDSSIVLECENKRKLKNSDLKLYVLDPNNGEPRIIGDEFKQDRSGNLYFSEIKLPKKAFGRYRLTWNADTIFNVEGHNSKNTSDESQLTKW